MVILFVTAAMLHKYFALKYFIVMTIVAAVIVSNAHGASKLNFTSFSVSEISNEVYKRVNFTFSNRHGVFVEFMLQRKLPNFDIIVDVGILNAFTKRMDKYLKYNFNGCIFLRTVKNQLLGSINREIQKNGNFPCKCPIAPVSIRLCLT